MAAVGTQTGSIPAVGDDGVIYVGAGAVHAIQTSSSGPADSA